MAWIRIIPLALLISTVISEEPHLLVSISPSGLILKRINEELILTCQFKSPGSSNYTIKWRLPTTISPEKDDRISIVNQTHSLTLKLQNLRDSDSGYYICEVTNGHYNIWRTVKVSVKQSSGRCLHPFFSCGNKKICIPRRYMCDGYNDCPDGADEAYSVCGTNSCDDKIYCEDGRCIPKEMCCDRTIDPECPAFYLVPCCEHYLNDIRESLARMDSFAQHSNDIRFLQSTVYTIISCAVAFVFIAAIVIFAVCHCNDSQRRTPSWMSTPRPRLQFWPWSRNGDLDNTTVQPRIRFSNRQASSLDSSCPQSCMYPLQNSFVVSYRDINGVQVLEHLPKPPPYSEQAESPPPYPATSENASSTDQPLLHQTTQV